MKKRDRQMAELYGQEPDAVALTMERAYRNTVYCTNEIDQKGAKLTGRYCGNRWCLVCNRVRTGLAIARYYPVVSAWRAAYFVTLTAPNVPGTRLAAELRRYLGDFVAIKLAMRRTHGVKLVALRKTECTYNADARTYHPHFHIVVQGRRAAELLRDMWLERRPDATAIAQNVQRATPGTLRELFKYFTKLVTKRRQANGSASVRVVDAARLDVLFTAMRGLRVFQPVGFVLPKDDDDESARIGEKGHTAAPDWMRDRLGDFPAEGARYVWQQEATDWLDFDAVCLSGYTPTAGMRALAGITTGGP